MPVRIYDIAKKLGLESKEVLAKAKELGIASARVASSSLDKITAEYLESHFTPPKPAAPTPPPPIPAQESIVVVTTPPEAAPQLGPEIKTESLSAEPRIERPEPTPTPAITVTGEAPVTVEAKAPANDPVTEPVTTPPEAPPAEPEPAPR